MLACMGLRMIELDAYNCMWLTKIEKSYKGKIVKMDWLWPWGLV